MHILQYFVCVAIASLGILPQARATFREDVGGNIAVDLSSDLYYDFQSADVGMCAARHRFRRDVEWTDCLTQGCEDVLSHDEILADLNREAQSPDKVELHNMVNPDENQALGRILVFAGDRLPRRNIPQNNIVGVANLAFLLTSQVTWSGNGKLGRHFIIDSSHRAKQRYQPACPEEKYKPACDNVLCEGKNGKCGDGPLHDCPCQETKSCPPDDRMPDCDNCGGNNGMMECKGLSNKDDLFEGCPCFYGRELGIEWPYLMTQRQLADGAAWFKNPPQYSEKPKRPDCYGLGTKTYAEQPAASSVVVDFAGDEKLYKGYGGETTQHVYNSGSWNQLKLSIKFKGDKNTQYSVHDAKDVFMSIINDCDVPGSPDPNPKNYKHGGTKASFEGHLLTFQPLQGDPTFNCDPDDPDGLKDGYKVAMRRDGMAASIPDFCKNQAGKEIDRGISIEYGPFGPPSAGGGLGRQSIWLEVHRPGAQTEDCATWDGKVDESVCNYSLMGLTDKCNTNTIYGKRGGSVNAGCAEWKIEGSGGADMYRLHLHQQMKGDWQALSWEVYDSRENKVGGPGAGPNPDGAPYKIGFWVESPTNKDDTNVKVRYPDTPVNAGFGGLQYQWATGSLNGGKGSVSWSSSYWCDDVLDQNGAGGWKGWGAGFEREFNCYFRGWANSDGLAGDPP